jgi:DNA-binding CsgD family transcriptional regulator/PAS domain-containing protein
MASRSESDLLELVRLAYAGALDPTVWRAFLARYAAMLDGATVWFMFFDRRTNDSWVSAEVGPASDAGAMRDYNEYYRTRNPLITRRTHYMQPGLINVSQARYPVEKFLRTEFYNDFCRPLDVGCAIGACILETQGVCAHISCLRSLRSGLFRKREVQFLRPLLPHIQRALQIHLRLKGLRLDHETQADAVDRLQTGVFFVTGEGRVLFANASARRLLETRDGLTITAGILSAQSHADWKALRRMIAACGRSARGEGLSSGGLLQIARPSLRNPLSVLVAPTAPSLTYPTVPPGCVTVLVRDPDELQDTSVILARQYRLTPVESKLASLLLQGHAIDVSGEHLAISRETARTHLKAILKKSGTNRQSEFVRTMMKGLPGNVVMNGPLGDARS